MIRTLPDIWPAWYNDPRLGNDTVSRYHANQSYIAGLPLLETGSLPPDGSSNLGERWNANYGFVYSWDPDADHGKGAWGITGIVKAGHLLPGDPGFDPENDIDWLDDEGYKEWNFGDDFYE